MTRPIAIPLAPGSLAPPSGLSPWACDVWQELTRLHDFAAHELVVFERALLWWDRSDAAAKAGDLKLAMDASSAALRHWRTLKFPVPAGVRRPGRPSGENWSAARQAAARR